MSWTMPTIIVLALWCLSVCLGHCCKHSTSIGKEPRTPSQMLIQSLLSVQCISKALPAKPNRARRTRHPRKIVCSATAAMLRMPRFNSRYTAARCIHGDRSCEADAINGNKARLGNIRLQSPPAVQNQYSAGPRYRGRGAQSPRQQQQGDRMAGADSHSSSQTALQKSEAAHALYTSASGKQRTTPAAKQVWDSLESRRKQERSQRDSEQSHALSAIMWGLCNCSDRYVSGASDSRGQCWL